MSEKTDLEIMKVSPKKMLIFYHTLLSLEKKMPELEFGIVFAANEAYPNDRAMRLSLAYRHMLLNKMSDEEILALEKRYFIKPNQIIRKKRRGHEISDALIAAAAVAEIEDETQFNLESLGTIATAFCNDFKRAICLYEGMN